MPKTGSYRKNNKSTRHSPSSLHSLLTTRNTLAEKLMRRSNTWRSGSCIRSTLCIGVNWSCVSAWTPYWSNVDRVRSSQMFSAGHQRAWSDQSNDISARDDNGGSVNFINIKAVISLSTVFDLISEHALISGPPPFF